MPNYNHTTFLGRITADPELRKTKGGTSVTTFCVVANDRFKNAAGELVEEPTFLDCELFGRGAEVFAEHMRKGRHILVTGRLRNDRWEKDGKAMSKIVLKVGDFSFIDKPVEN